ncbi:MULTISPECIES: histidine phosphatase family protein [Pseudonocardia]|uniref:2,3-bisphosphoglycerate-dependent phosphoglycerate mutase n=2 Tax=Pseudonocardia TaxID=1847 RepID=A0A1Y2MU92_PSEAH|nr:MULTISPECIES: histidine phosphatase family protein [Pseudonocardia]OSY38765.1 2,3-bisphosphoglycerate-dependent phosphoglycerate mutase [Pseudonocardia autotrophica]TDN74967.1 putative phosphoglycerate mutase [Pseudonocardia autotrophica]BBF98905.1 hypothetical protein Pdca_01150 [Pseudonocardia autotrophica]GEC27815.1 hypothetical protein PSA01_48440 [Pseudonocardia saturnea]
MSDDTATAFAAAGGGIRDAEVPPDDGAVRLVLVRHGRTPSNVRHALDTGVPGPSLDELGHEQAAEVGRLFVGWPVRAVYASLATRARETAAPIGAALGVDVQLLQGAHEIFVGDLDNRADDDARAQFDEVFAAWWDGDVDRPMPGGESARDVWNRFLPDLDAVLGGVDSGAVVVVSHGAAIRLATFALLGARQGAVPGIDPDAVSRALPGAVPESLPDVGPGAVPGSVPATFGRDRPVPNTGRVVLRRDPGGWVVELWDPMPGGRTGSH